MKSSKIGRPVSSNKRTAIWARENRAKMPPEEREAYRAYQRAKAQERRDRETHEEKKAASDRRMERAMAEKLRDPVAWAQKRANYACRYRKRQLAHTRNRQAAKLLATPPWADKHAIIDFYLKCPEGMTVDHVYPLKSDWVCGLHIVANLQYLTLSENSTKGNRRVARYHD